jgi:hypothetical protein
MPCRAACLSVFLGMLSDVADETERFASAKTRLGPADLTTVDALIAGGSAEVMRWVIGRIRENPAYAEFRERVREIGELKARF